MRSDTWLRTAEFLLWVGVVATGVVVASTVVGLLAGGNFIAVKYVLFVVGFVLFGIGSLSIQPKSLTKEAKREALEAQADKSDGEASTLTRTRLALARRPTTKDLVTGDDTSDFEAFLLRIPPLRGNYLPYERRVSRPVKIFVTSLVVLGVSLAMELVLDVSVS